MSMEDRVREIIASVFKLKKEQLTDNMDFIKDLNAQSYDIAELIALLEEEFQVEIDPLRARQNKTIGQVIDYIKELTKR